MKIGFVGAGKVGFSMGKYLTERRVNLSGYYSRNPQSSMEAANFTGTRQYLTLKDLVADSDALFLAVPDDAIAAVWEQLKMLPIQNKILGHFSGSLSSAVFSDIMRYHAYGYSIHPLFAINDKYNSYQELSKAFFTIEGHTKYQQDFLDMFQSFGNKAEIIPAEAKVRYHAAAAMASNLYVGLAALCEQMLRGCGFSAEHAHEALVPLILGNAENIVKNGTKLALTGPVERNDTETVQKHLRALTPEETEVYRCLSKQVLKIAKEKYPERDYHVMEGALEK